MNLIIVIFICAAGSVLAGAKWAREIDHARGTSRQTPLYRTAQINSSFCTDDEICDLCVGSCFGLCFGGCSGVCYEGACNSSPQCHGFCEKGDCYGQCLGGCRNCTTKCRPPLVCLYEERCVGSCAGHCFGRCAGQCIGLCSGAMSNGLHNISHASYITSNDSRYIIIRHLRWDMLWSRWMFVGL